VTALAGSESDGSGIESLDLLFESFAVFHGESFAVFFDGPIDEFFLFEGLGFLVGLAVFETAFESEFNIAFCKTDEIAQHLTKALAPKLAAVEAVA